MLVRAFPLRPDLGCSKLWSSCPKFYPIMTMSMHFAGQALQKVTCTPTKPQNSILSCTRCDMWSHPGKARPVRILSNAAAQGWTGPSPVVHP